MTGTDSRIFSNRLSRNRTTIRIATILVGILLFFSLIPAPGYALQNSIKYDLNLQLNHRNSTLSGAEKITFTNNGQSALDTIYLHIQPNAFRNRDTRGFQKYEDQMEAPAFIKIASVLTGSRSATVLKPETVNPAIILSEPLRPADSIEILIHFVTKIPTGKSYLCPTHSEKIYRLIFFYPRIACYYDDRWLTARRDEIEQPYLEFATYSLKLTLPQDLQPAGSLESDSISVLPGNKYQYVFKPELLQDIGFILHDNFRVSTLRSQTRSRIKLINRITNSDRRKDKITIEIIQDIINHYTGYHFNPAHHLTVSPTIIPGGFMTSNLILLDKTILSDVSKLDYMSIHILAREIARQYLGQDQVDNKSASIFISNGLAGLLADEYLQQRYQYLRKRYQFPENRLVTYSNRLMNLFLASLEKENLLQPVGSTNERANNSFISEQTQYLKSQKLIGMTRYALGDSLFQKVLEQYRAFIQINPPDPAEFFRIAESESGYQFVAFYNYYQKSDQAVDIKIVKVKKSRTTKTIFRADVIVKQTPRLFLPLEISAIDRNDSTYYKKEMLGTGKTDTLTLITAQPIRKITLDPHKQIWDSNRYNNQHPHYIVFNFLTGLPRIDAYQVFYYPTFDFNSKDLTRIGIKLRGRYWINMRPLLPAQSLDEWSFGLNYGYKSKTLGYDLSYSTALLAIFLKPRIYLRLRDYFDLQENQISTEFYLGDITYWGLNRIHGYQKMDIGLDYQHVRSLKFLNAANWETGTDLKPFLDYVNFHNWGNVRHIVRAQFSYGLPVSASKYSYDKLSIDGQIKVRTSERIWFYQRLFFGNSHGKLPKQEYFYFFGKNILENQAFESYRLAKGEGDMRGYGEQTLKGRKILTSNTELHWNLAGISAAMFDFLVFFDTGFLPESFRSGDRQTIRSDAGLGLELEVLETLKLGMHFPVWVSQPSKSELPFALRWVVTADLRR